MTTVAQKLRKQPSLSERRMWRLLQPFRVGGYHFRKQVAIGPYVADFVCHHAMVVIEVDGEQHGAAIRNDELRDDYMRSRGFRIVRVPSVELIDNQKGVYDHIAAVLSDIPPRARSTPLQASLGRFAPSSATSPAGGEVPSPSTPGVEQNSAEEQHG
jgi:very-short-patch-repair endonuclease